MSIIGAVGLQFACRLSATSLSSMTVANTSFAVNSVNRSLSMSKSRCMPTKTCVVVSVAGVKIVVV